jgi:hypothetical protein
MEVDSDICVFAGAILPGAGSSIQEERTLNVKLEMRTELAILCDSIDSMHREIKRNEALVAQLIERLEKEIAALRAENAKFEAARDEAECTLDRYESLFEPVLAASESFAETVTAATGRLIAEKEAAIRKMLPKSVGKELLLQLGELALEAVLEAGGYAAAAAVPGAGALAGAAMLLREAAELARLSEQVSSLKDLRELQALRGKAATQKIEKMLSAQKKKIAENTAKMEANNVGIAQRKEQIDNLRSKYFGINNGLADRIWDAYQDIDRIRDFVARIQPYSYPPPLK